VFLTGSSNFIILNSNLKFRIAEQQSSRQCIFKGVEASSGIAAREWNDVWTGNILCQPRLATTRPVHEEPISAPVYTHKAIETGREIAPETAFAATGNVSPCSNIHYANDDDDFSSRCGFDQTNGVGL
jgi:hypothetical protein